MLYRDAFEINDELSEEAIKSITRQFLRGIPQDISKKLQLDHPEKNGKELAKEAKRMEEVTARVQSSTVHAVNTSGSQDQIDALRGELQDLKVMLQNKVDNTQTNAVAQGNRRCFGCGSTAHLLSNCDRQPSTRGRGESLRGGYRGRIRGRGGLT